MLSSIDSFCLYGQAEKKVQEQSVYMQPEVLILKEQYSVSQNELLNLVEENHPSLLLLRNVRQEGVKYNLTGKSWRVKAL